MEKVCVGEPLPKSRQMRRFHPYLGKASPRTPRPPTFPDACVPTSFLLSRSLTRTLHQTCNVVTR